VSAADRGIGVLDRGPHAPRKKGFMGGGLAPTGFSGVFIEHAQLHIRRICGPILTIYTSYDVFPCKDVQYGGSVDISLH